MATLFFGSLAAACSEQAAPAPASGGTGGLTTTATAGSPSGGSLTTPPLTSSGSGGAAGSGTSGSAGAGVAATAGASGSAGSGGVGITPYVPPVSSVLCPPTHQGGLEVTIADFDDGLEIAAVDGRGGIWFGYSDGTGTQTDNPIPVVDSDLGGKAMHVTGSGFTNWGSGIGCAIAFDFDKNAQCPYDASAFAGVRLKLKGSGSARLRITQVATTPVTASDRKGSCDPTRAVCDGHHEVTIPLTASWTEHEFVWADFKQVFGQLVDLDAKAIIGLSFEFNSLTSYDVWVDDVAFTHHGAGGAGAGGAGAGGDSAGGADAQ